MPKQKSRSLFTVRRIANRNSCFTRITRLAGGKIWRLAVMILLVAVGIASLFLFDGNFESSYFGADVATDLLGDGFKAIGGFTDDSSNPQLKTLSGDHSKDGVGTINALLYNVKTYIKYIAGGAAVLFFIVAAIQIILASNDEDVKKGKQNLVWIVIALISIFTIDVAVTALFEGGGSEPGKSFFNVEVGGEDGSVNIEENTEFFESMAKYFQGSAREVFDYIQVLTGAVAVFFIVIAGMQMMTASGNEEKIDKEKKYILHILTAFIVLLLTEPFIFGFIYPSNTGTAEGINDPICVEIMNLHRGELGEAGEHSIDLTTLLLPTDLDKKYGVSMEELLARTEKCKTAAESGAFATSEILGIVRFFESLIGGIAIFFLVYSAVVIAASFGEEETITKHKKQIFGSLGGLALVVLSHSLISGFFFVVDPTTGEAMTNVSNGVILLARATNFVATFVGVLAVISIVVAGFMWVANFGNDEIASKAKKVILAAVIGVVLSISAYAIVNTLISTDSEVEADVSISI